MRIFLLSFPSSALAGRLRALSAARLAVTLLLGGCGSETTATETRGKDGPPPELRAAASAGPAPILDPAPPAPADPASIEPAVAEGPCGAEMALIAGDYCLTPEQRCVAHQDIAVEGHTVPNQCLKYAQPVSCWHDRRQPMRFCMDRYEWPNKRGDLPRVLTSWQDARAMCASAGKRLCTEEEFNFACEGEEMRPYVYGYERDATKCNFDRPYRPRTFNFTAWEACLGADDCRKAFEAIDQRLAAGSIEACRSPEGVYDLNGNVNEWVMIPRGKPPHRSGLKGGWWGPVRDRCRPTVTFHDEGDFGYEVGFRCCSDAG